MKVDPLPQATVGQIIGLLEFLEDVKEKKDIHKFAQELQYDLDDLYPIIDACEMLHFVEIENGDIKLSEEGRLFLESDINKRKKMFKRSLKKIRAYKEVINLLKEATNQEVDREKLVNFFSDYFPEEQAEELVHTLIDWGRYAELIGYNSNSEEVYLDHER